MVNDAGNASPVDQVFWNFINDAESPVSLTSSQKDAIAQAMTSIDPADSAAGDAFCGQLTSLNQVLRSTMTDTEADAIMGELQKHDVAYKNVASLMEVMNFLEDGAEILTAGAVYTDPKTVPTPQEVLAVTYDNWGAGKSDLYGVPSFDAVAGAAASGFEGTDPNANFYNILASEMENSFIDNEGLISFDQEYNTKSCYVELHRNGELSLIWFVRGNARKRLFQFPLKPSSRT